MWWFRLIYLGSSCVSYRSEHSFVSYETQDLIVLPAQQTCFQQAVWSFSSEGRWSETAAFFRNANTCKNKCAAIHPNPVKIRQSWAKVLEKHLNKDALCSKTWSSSLTPTFMSLSDLTVICQCSSASLLAVTDGASYTPLTLYLTRERFCHISVGRHQPFYRRSWVSRDDQWMTEGHRQIEKVSVSLCVPRVAPSVQ